MDEQSPDFEADKQPGASAPEGELRRDRKALRGGARSESAARKSLFGRSRPEQSDAGPDSADVRSRVDKVAQVESESPFAALNLEPDNFGTPTVATPLPPQAPVPASVESPPFQVPTAGSPLSDQPDFDAPLFETPVYEQPTFARRTFEPPQPPPQDDVDSARFRPPAADLPERLPEDAAAGAPPSFPPPATDWEAFGRLPGSPGFAAQEPAAAPQAPQAPPIAAPAAPDWSSLGHVPTAAPSGFVGQPAPTAHFPAHDAAGSGPSGLGQLRPTPREVPTELAVLDTAAIVTAVVVPPVGLILGIVASIRGRLYRGWASNLARAAIVVSIIMSIVFALGGAYLWVEQKKLAEEQAAVAAAAAARDGIVAESEPFCGALASYPTLFASEDPDYGWPLLEDPAGYLPAIANYNAVWQSLVPLAPSGIAPQVQTFSERINGIVSLASSLQATNRTGDLLGVHQSDDITTIGSYVEEYCE